MRCTYIYDNTIAQFFFEHGMLLAPSTPSNACGVDSLPSVARFSQPEGLLSGYCKWEVPAEQRSTIPAVTHTQHTWLLGIFFYIWQMYNLRFTATIQIYSTLEGVPTALAQTQLTVTF